jgi:hypothetical protein
VLKLSVGVLLFLFVVTRMTGVDDPSTDSGRSFILAAERTPATEIHQAIVGFACATVAARYVLRERFGRPGRQTVVRATDDAYYYLPFAFLGHTIWFSIIVWCEWGALTTWVL